MSVGTRSFDPIEPVEAKKPVSIIICAKNEAANLKQNLPSILGQRYMNEAGNPLFEVVVVNDASIDDTEAVLSTFKDIYNNLHVINLDESDTRTLPGKKHALNAGVRAAQHDLLLFTDADCMPASENWITLMAAYLQQGKDIVIGYGKYKEAIGVLNSFIKWETVHSFMQYHAYTLAGKPYMAVGRNLACRKNIWQDAQHAAAWSQLPSGDDDLLMQAMANKENTTIVALPGSHTITEAKKSWNEWARQKQRHLSTGKYYKPGIKAWLSIYASSHAAMWLLFLVLLFCYDSLLASDIIAVRCILYGISFARMSNKLEERNLTRYLLLFDIGWMVYNFAFSPYIIWKNKKQWT